MVLPGLGPALEGLISAFTATQKWSSFGAAPQAGLPGGNVISGRPEVATNARALTRILSGASAAGSPPAAPSSPGGLQPGGPIPVTITQPSAINLAREIGRQGGLQGGKPAAGPLGGLWTAMRGIFGAGGPQGSALAKISPLAVEPDIYGLQPSTERPSWHGPNLHPEITKGYDLAADATGSTDGGGTGGRKGGWLSRIGDLFKQKAPTYALEGEMTGAKLFGGLGSAAGAVAGFATAAIGAGSVVVGVAEALHAFASAVNESNRSLAKFHGGLAVAFAQADIHAIQREMHQAMATGGTGTMLAGESTKLADEFQPIAEELSSLKNVAATGAVEILRVLTAIWKATDMVAGPALRWIEEHIGAGEEELPIQDLMDFLQVQNGRQEIRDVIEARGSGSYAKKPDKQGIGGIIAEGVADGLVPGLGAINGLRSAWENR